MSGWHPLQATGGVARLAGTHQPANPPLSPDGFLPHRLPPLPPLLLVRQVGYMLVGMKDTRSARVGDTWHLARRPVEQLPGFKPAKSMVFAGEHRRWLN